MLVGARQHSANTGSDHLGLRKAQVSGGVLAARRTTPAPIPLPVLTLADACCCCDAVGLHDASTRSADLPGPTTRSEPHHRMGPGVHWGNLRHSL